MDDGIILWVSQSLHIELRTKNGSRSGISVEKELVNSLSAFGIVVEIKIFLQKEC